MKSFEHEPVMIGEVLDILNLGPGSIYVDCTLGGAGHAIEAAKRVSPGGMVIGLDIDKDAIDAAETRLAGIDCKASVVKASYTELDAVLLNLGITGADAILFDLGVSSFQLDESERGFTYREEAHLDMRMDRSKDKTAEDIVNEADEKQLISILRDFGEEKWAVRIAKFITSARLQRRITTTAGLIEIIEAAIPKGAREKGQHPARRTFQALRIAVNTELDNVATGIPKAIDSLNPGGRIAVISYHSLEDRIVKNLFRQSENPCTCPPDLPICACGLKAKVKIITKKPILPKDDEIERNPRSRSAKLRAAEKITWQE